jgi:DNA-directed RNA polymerase specialized sigma24 family protein
MEEIYVNEDKARSFTQWFNDNMDKLKYLVRDYDEDLFMDAFFRAHDAIERRGTLVRNNTGYFLQTYRTTLLDSKRSTVFVYEDERVLKDLTATEFDADEYEEAAEGVTTELLEYVRERYDPVSVSLFEIYIGLSPNASYKRMADMLGISGSKIGSVIGGIKKDVANKFGDTYNMFRSSVDF